VLGAEEGKANVVSRVSKVGGREKESGREQSTMEWKKKTLYIPLVQLVQGDCYPLFPFERYHGRKDIPPCIQEGRDK